MTIDQIIEEFDEKFYGDMKPRRTPVLTKESDLGNLFKNFIRTSFASYKEGLAEKVEKMRSEVSMQPRFPGGPDARRIQWQMETIENVLALIKQS